MDHTRVQTFGYLAPIGHAHTHCNIKRASTFPWINFHHGHGTLASRATSEKFGIQAPHSKLALCQLLLLLATSSARPTGGDQGEAGIIEDLPC
jgi:hypothetical protein